MTDVCLLRMSPSRRIFPLLAFLVLLAVLGLGGCAKPVVVTPPSPAPAPPEVSVGELLRTQYDTWRGVPHRIGGTDKRGVDCSGLVRSVFRDAFHVELPRTSAEQSRVGRPVPLGEIRPGDLVYFSDKGGDHIGVIMENRVFLHSSATLGVMLSELDGYWLPRLRRIQRVLP